LSEILSYGTEIPTWESLTKRFILLFCLQSFLFHKTQTGGDDMKKGWISISVTINQDKKEPCTLASFLNNNSIGPTEVLILRKRTTIGTSLVIDMLVYTFKSVSFPEEIELSGF